VPKHQLTLLPQDRPATLEDVRRFALHTTESLKEQLEEPSAVLHPMATHRQGFRQKREVVSLLRRAGYGAIAPQELSEELKGMVNRKKLALIMARAISAIGAEHRPHRHRTPMDHRCIQEGPAQRIKRLQPSPGPPVGQMHRTQPGEAQRLHRTAA
jgi:hypothetical protein